MLPLFMAIGGVPPTCSFLQGSMDNTDATTYTFSSQNLGAADARRWIIVCVTAVTNVARSISSVTVAGVSAVQLAVSEGSQVFRHISIWAAKVPTGTSGNIVVTWSSGVSRCGYAAYRLLTDVDPTQQLYASATDNTLSTNTLSLSINRVSNGIVIAAATCAGTSANSCSWSGVTEDYDAQWSEATGQVLSVASIASGTPPISVSVTFANTTANSAVLAAASFR